MLSDYFYCGLVTGGAMLGVALLAGAIPRDRDISEDARSLAVLIAAFAEGIGVMALVVGMSAIFIVTDAGGIAAAAAVSFPALLLGVPAGWVLRLRDLPAEHAGTRASIILLASYMAGLAIITAVVVLLAILLEDGAGANGFDVVVAVMAVLGAACAVGIGYVGAQGLVELRDSASPEGHVEVAAVRSRALIRASVLTAIGVGTLIAVLLLMFID